MFPTVWGALVVQTMPVETETCLKICQLEFRATKIAMALLADERTGNARRLSLGRRSLAHTFNKCMLMTVDRNVTMIFNGGKCQMHFRVRMADDTMFQVDQPISRQRYTLFGSYKLDAHRVDLIDKVLRENRTGLRIRKWTATEMLHLKVTKRLLDELRGNAEKCGQNLSQYCTTILSGKHPHLSAEQRMKLVINGRSYDWWREHLITALEFFDRMRDKVLNMGD